MRSRYAAFSLGLADYLLATLATGHPDLDEPSEPMRAALAAMKDTQRFQRLLVLHAAVDGDEGEVLFFAGVFGKGPTPAKRGEPAAHQNFSPRCATTAWATSRGSCPRWPGRWRRVP